MRKNINGESYTSHLIINPEWNEEVDKRIREEIHKMNEFEFYFGIKETPERLQMISINRELFYSIYEKESNILVGYLGFTEREKAWEPEIYIFNSFRGKGYGTEALNVMIAGLFAGLLLIERDEEKENVITESIISTVRENNIASHRMMEKLGFKRNKDIACCFNLYVNPEDEEDCSLFKVVEYTLTRQEFFYRFGS